MSNKVFKNSGLQIAESKDGDILIYNKSLKVETIIDKAFLDKAEINSTGAREFAKKIADVLRKNTLARWERVIKNAEEIKNSGIPGREFIATLKQHLEKRDRHSLRKIEKDIYFFMEENDSL